MGRHTPKAWPIQKSSKPGGFRSKAPAVNERDRVGSYMFSAIDLPRERGTIERRGATTSGTTINLPGALVPCYRVIRPL